MNNLIHSLGTLLKFGGQTVPMLSTNPLDPYSIAKSLIFIIAVNSKIERPPRLTELEVLRLPSVRRTAGTDARLFGGWVAPGQSPSQLTSLQ